MRNFIFGAILALSINCQAEDISVKNVRLAGPYTVQPPIVLDSMTLDNKKYSTDQALDAPLSFDALKTAALDTIPQNRPIGSLNLIGFTISTTAYAKVEVKVEGPKLKKVYIANAEKSQSQLNPGEYDVVVKYIADTTDVKVTVSTDKQGTLTLKDSNSKRTFSMDDLMEMKRYSGLSLSPSGKYLMTRFSYFDNKGKTVSESKITEVETGRIISHNTDGLYWMPRSDKYYKVKEHNGNSSVIVTDPATGVSETFATNLPSKSFTISPTEDYLIYYIYNEGPKKQDGVYEVVHPDDRQPGYRGRYSLGRYDIKSGLARPITYGYHSTSMHDISHDGRYLIFSVAEDNITGRPSDLRNYFILDFTTMKAEPVIEKEGFLGSIAFYPNSTEKLIAKASPESFGGIGNLVPEGMTPSIFDYHLYKIDIATKKVTPIAQDFNPSIESIQPSAADGMIYFTAENADSVSVYKLNPLNDEIKMIDQPMQVVNGVTIADNAPLMMLHGTSSCIPDRIYSVALGKKKTAVSLVEDLNAGRMSELTIGQCLPMAFQCSRGYTVTGHYYLPANFDAAKKYPVIVHYYGGCSPTSLRFGGGSHYPAHYWNALGYITLIVNPSGAAGFGQEWAARHVNTAGEGVAEDIIEAVKWFADNNQWVNKDKIGCVSASYGGFMTQCLLSKTDIFACGISHAGISDHTSYWGEGYWGYSYSQVSMANSFPWNRKDLYVDRSPLYNADKIKDPILFTHGTADTNVPVGESIQMYTAMKILGVPTAFVLVEGENHGIMEYSKRKKWINTMVAWFDRWLKDDATWWNGMYPEVKD